MAKAGLFSTMTVAVLAGLLGATPVRAEADQACSAPDALMRFDRAISHTAARIAEGRSLKVVALGSSSTVGIGATSPANSYPSRLEAALREQYPDMQIEVINRGVGGEDAREELARLDKSVLAERPDLVLWQVGTNAIVDEEGVSEEGTLVRKGLARLKAAGVDVILIDPQYSPSVIRSSRAGAMVRMLKTVAQAANVAVFRRFAIMGHWRTVEHVPFERFTVKDGLHMNDWGYQCIARLLATSIVAAASRPVPVAGGSLVQQARL
jgi:acyl-CoA thioesterase I